MYNRRAVRRGEICMQPETAAHADRDALASFLADGFPECDAPMWRARMRYWWDENPAATPETPPGWILRDGEALKGFLGLVPTSMRIGGALRTVHNLTSWYVAEDAREQSLSLFRAAMRAGAETVVFDTTPTARVQVILRRFRFRPLLEDRIPVHAYAVRPFHPFPRMTIHMLRLRRVPSALSSIRALPEAARGEGDLGDGFAVQIEPEPVGTEYDALWERTCGQFPNTNARTADALNWLAFRNPWGGKYLVALRRAGRLAGWCLANRRLRRKLLDLDCLDWWQNFDDAPTARALVRGLRRVAYSLGCSTLTLPQYHPRIAEASALLGGVYRRTSRSAGFYRPPKTGKDPVRSGGLYAVRLQGDHHM